MIAQAPQPRTPRSNAPRRRYHFHLPGLLYVIVTFFIAVGAINSQNNLLFASLGLAIGGLLMSGILSGASLLGVRCERGPIGTGSVGRRLVLTYRVRNENRFVPAFGLFIAEHQRGVRDGAATNWAVFIQRPKAFVSHIGARQSVEVTAEVLPRVRGRLSLGQVRVSTTFPFGLARKSVGFELPAFVIIYPVELPVAPGILRRLAVRASSGVGAAVSPGMGDEFYGLREYADGDSPRLIAWRRSARTGQMVVRQSTMPTPRQLWLVLNIPSGVSTQTPLVERAIAITAAVLRAAVREGASVGLAIPRAGIAMQPQVAGRAVRAMLEHLAELDVSLLSERGVIPEAALRSAASAVIHAGPVDRSMGSVRSFHISAANPGEILAPGEALTRALAMLDGEVQPEEPVRPAWASPEHGVRP